MFVDPVLSNDCWCYQGHLESSTQLHWKVDLEEEAANRDEKVKTTKYAGVVPGIKRVRKFEVGPYLWYDGKCCLTEVGLW